MQSVKTTQYVVYQGDEVIAVGTKSQCAKILGVSKSTIDRYANPSSFGARRCAVRVNDG